MKWLLMFCFLPFFRWLAFQVLTRWRKTDDFLEYSDAWKTWIQVHSSLQLENLNFKFQELDSKSNLMISSFILLRQVFQTRDNLMELDFLLNFLERFSFLGGFFFGDFECADYDGSSVLWMFKCRILITGSSVFLNVFGREFYGWFQMHGKLSGILFLIMHFNKAFYQRYNNFLFFIWSKSLNV
ncbi:unnamed protein product [Rhizophagus irregularis]|nr:unnamed protein product [Rhizophagus irregularis]